MDGPLPTCCLCLQVTRGKGGLPFRDVPQWPVQTSAPRRSPWALPPYDPGRDGLLLLVFGCLCLLTVVFFFFFLSFFLGKGVLLSPVYVEGDS